MSIAFVPFICVEDPSQQGYNFISLQVLRCQFLDTSGHSIVVEAKKPETCIQKSWHTLA